MDVYHIVEEHLLDGLALAAVGEIAHVNLLASIGTRDERNEITLIFGFVGQQVVEVVLDAGDVVEVCGRVEQITVEQCVEDAERVDVLLLFDGVAHQSRLQVDVRLLIRIDQTDLGERVHQREGTEGRGRSYLVEEISVHVLIDGIGEPVADGHAFEIDARLDLWVLILHVDLVGDRRDVFTAVAFAGDEERILCVVGVDLEELRESGVEIASHVLLRTGIALIARGEAVACADGIVDEEKMVVLVPGHRSCLNVFVGIDEDRTDLGEESEQGRSTGSTLQPEHHGCVGLVAILRRKEPEEHVRIEVLVHR